MFSILAKQPLMASMALLLQRVVHRRSASAPNAREERRLSGPTPDFLNQNLPFRRYQVLL